MSLYVETKIYVEGVLTAPDAVPTLTDPDSTYGVRRADTLAVIAAAGTLMTLVSTGIYRYEIATPVSGVIYEYYIRAVVDGDVYQFPGTVSLNDDEVPSYLSAADATALANQLPGLASFKAGSDAEKLAALKLATDRFDTARRYQGRKYLPTQTLEFPRQAYGSTGASSDWEWVRREGSAGDSTGIWDWDATTSAAIVPAKVKRAVLYEADSILKGDLDAKLDARFTGLLSQTVGSVSESYAAFAQVGGDGAPVLCREADRISRQYQLRSGQVL